MAGSFFDLAVLFLAKIFGFGAVFWYISTHIFRNELPLWVVNHAYGMGFALGLAGMLTYRVLIYPTFLDPLRFLPRPDDGASSGWDILTETPRGITPLRWIKESPDADIINTRGLLGRSRLLPVSPNALRDLLSTNSYDFEKPLPARSFLARIIGWGLILSEGNAHRHQRKALTPAFNIRNIRALYGLMWQKSEIFLEQLQKEQKREGYVEISQWASRLTLDIIGPAALSRDFQTMTSDNEDLANAFSEILDPTPEKLLYFGLNFAFPQWIARNLPLQANRDVTRNTAWLREVCGGILQQKISKVFSSKRLDPGIDLDEETDILRNIIVSQEFKDDEIVDQMLTFLAAGHETTAMVITWTAYMLSKHPDAQSKLREEVVAAIPTPDTPITANLLEALPYLNGVCNEVLRLFPTVPMTIRESKRQTSLAGTVVPADTFILVCPYAVNRHPRYWGPHADQFIPDRWIDVDEHGVRRPNKHGGTESNYSEITFLHGPRSCIGRDFAKAELRCAIAAMVKQFEIALLNPVEEVVIAGSVTTKPRNGMKVVLKPVNA